MHSLFWGYSLLYNLLRPAIWLTILIFVHGYSHFISPQYLLTGSCFQEVQKYRHSSLRYYNQQINFTLFWHVTISEIWIAALRFKGADPDAKYLKTPIEIIIKKKSTKWDNKRQTDPGSRSFISIRIYLQVHPSGVPAGNNLKQFQST